MAKKFDVVGSGYVPCNKKRFREARLVFFRPGWGIISVEFGNGLKVGMRRDERDEKGRLKDDFVRVIEYHGDQMCDISSETAEASKFRGIGSGRARRPSMGSPGRPIPRETFATSSLMRSRRRGFRTTGSGSSCSRSRASSGIVRFLRE